MGVKAKFAASALALSLSGAAFIIQHEGLRQDSYLDSVGIPTICSGSTRGVYLGQHATLQECEVRLVEDTSYAGKAIARCITERMTQPQYDMLVSLGINIGGGALCRSTLVKKLNHGDCRGAADQFLRWDYAKGRRLKGLTNRRHDERAVFITGCTGD